MEATKATIDIYTDSAEGTSAFEAAWRAFVEDNAREGRAVTAEKLTAALGRWKSNPLVNAGIINFLK